MHVHPDKNMVACVECGQTLSSSALTCTECGSTEPFNATGALRNLSCVVNNIKSTLRIARPDKVSIGFSIVLWIVCGFVWLIVYNALAYLHTYMVDIGYIRHIDQSLIIVATALIVFTLIIKLSVGTLSKQIIYNQHGSCDRMSFLIPEVTENGLLNANNGIISNRYLTSISSCSECKRSIDKIIHELEEINNSIVLYPIWLQPKAPQLSNGILEYIKNMYIIIKSPFLLSPNESNFGMAYAMDHVGYLFFAPLLFLLSSGVISSDDFGLGLEKAYDTSFTALMFLSAVIHVLRLIDLKRLYVIENGIKILIDHNLNELRKL